MDKYYGCNIVESTVKKIPRSAPVKPKKRWRAFLVKLFISLAIIGVIAAVRYAPVAWLDPVRSVLRSVLCYDAFGRTAGGSAFFGAYV